MPINLPYLAICNKKAGYAVGIVKAGATLNNTARACTLAQQAFDTYRATSLEACAAFPGQIARNILDLGPTLIERAMLESGLPQARLGNEPWTNNFV